MKPSQLAAWIVSMNCTAANHGAEVATFELAHVVVGEQERLVPVATYDGNDDAKRIAEAALSDAREDAAITGGAQRFALVASASGKLIGRKAWIVAGGSDLSTELVSASEPPNLAGTTSQLMRHQEQTMRLALGSASALHELAQTEMLRLSNENARLRQEREETAAQREELAERRHEREIERAAALRRIELQGAVMNNVLLPLAPMLLAKLTGAPMAPRSATAAGSEVHPIDGLVGSMTPEQVQALDGVFTPAQMILLHEIFKESMERQGKRRPAAEPEVEASEVQ